MWTDSSRMTCYSAILVIGVSIWSAVTHRFRECQKVRSSIHLPHRPQFSVKMLYRFTLHYSMGPDSRARKACGNVKLCSYTYFRFITFLRLFSLNISVFFLIDFRFPPSCELTSEMKAFKLYALLRSISNEYVSFWIDWPIKCSFCLDILQECGSAKCVGQRKRESVCCIRELHRSNVDMQSH